MRDSDIQLITISLEFITIKMEKRLFGVILTILGITGLILAAYDFVQGNTSTNHSVKSVAVYGILGLLFFFAGIGLIRSTRDLTNRS
jgi:membrane associated rhomboid family serine protease